MAQSLDVDYKNGEHYKVIMNKSINGLAKPEFGPWKTLEIGRTHTPVSRHRQKEGSDLSLSDEEGHFDLDHSKVVRIHKEKGWQMTMFKPGDTVTASFGVFSESREKKQTLLGKLLSKDDEDKDQVLSYYRDIEGSIIASGEEFVFHVNHLASGIRFSGNNVSQAASFSSGDLSHGGDTLHTEPGGGNVDIVLRNQNGIALAGLKFQQKPLEIWVADNVDKNKQGAICAFFNIILALRDK